jgi:hypothetical protein
MNAYGCWWTSVILLMTGGIAERYLLARILAANPVWAYSQGFPPSPLAGYKWRELAAYYTAILWFHPRLRTNRFNHVLLWLAWIGLVPGFAFFFGTSFMILVGR